MSAHEQFADDLALLARGTLQGDERVALEKHLEGCAACRRELERLRGDTALLALSRGQRREPRRPEGFQDSAQIVTKLRALAGSGSIFAAGGVLLSAKRPPGAAGGAIAERISPAASPTGTRSRSSFHADLDRRDARDPGGGAGSAAAAGQGDLRSRPLESDFPGQQPAGVAAAEGVRVVADSDQRSAHPGRGVQTRRPRQRDCD